MLIDQVQRGFLSTVFALPAPVKRRLAGPPIVLDGQQLDLNAQLLARIEGGIKRITGEDRGTPAQARKMMLVGARSVAGKPVEVAATINISVSGATGPLDARVYRPLARAESGGVIVYFHGGGWVLGDIESHDNSCRALANATGMQVVSVDYRLAPEHRFPAAVDDAEAAFYDVVERAGEFGATPERVIVAGDSAGGHLSAMVALRARDAGGQAPAAQILIYPVADLVETYESERIFASGFVLTKADMDWFLDHFLVSGDQRAAASPLRAADLAGLPPALVITAGFDPLRDEGEAYARALTEAGNTVVLSRYDSQVHGFFNMLGVGSAAHEAIGEISGLLRGWLAPVPAAIR